LLTLTSFPTRRSSDLMIARPEGRAYVLRTERAMRQILLVVSLAVPAIACAKSNDSELARYVDTIRAVDNHSHVVSPLTGGDHGRSEEHTSELQSPDHL